MDILLQVSLSFMALLLLSCFLFLIFDIYFYLTYNKGRGHIDAYKIGDLKRCATLFGYYLDRKKRIACIDRICSLILISVIFSCSSFIVHVCYSKIKNPDLTVMHITSEAFVFMSHLFYSLLLI